MKLHVVIVALNNAQMTGDALRSLKAPDGFKLHLIDQESHEQFDLSGFDSTYHRFSPRVALSEAWNFGIIQALEDPECEYILIPNNDVLFHEVTVAKLIEGINTLGYAMVTAENVAPRYSVDQFFQIKNPGDIEFDSRPIQDWREEGPDFSCFMIKRDFVKKFGFFDENFFPAYCEDQDMHARIVLSGAHAKRLTTAPYYHFGSGTLANNSSIHALVSQGHNTNKVYYRKKWGNEHPEVLDRRGFQVPFNQAGPIYFWQGYEKYREHYDHN
jgi:GT2 family glycosyltransferase